jgi:hypothetical protein
MIIIMSPNNCKQCGSPAEIVYTPAGEFREYNMHYIAVDCTNYAKCGANLCLEVDPRYYRAREPILIEAWNKLND